MKSAKSFDLAIKKEKIKAKYFFLAKNRNKSAYHPPYVSYTRRCKPFEKTNNYIEKWIIPKQIDCRD